MSYSFTSKDAFKTITFAIKDALGKSIKVSDVRNAAARSEGFPSASEYLTALDDLSGISVNSIEIPESFETYFQEVQSKMLKLSKPFCFIRIDNDVHLVAAINIEHPGMYSTPLVHDDECELGEFVKAMNHRLGFSNTDDIKRAGFRRYTDDISLGFKPTAKCLTELNDPYKNPELVNILLHQDYGTAGYLQELVAHLWNSKWPCNLPNLLSNADHKHYRFVQGMLENYKLYGENSPSFRDVARKVVGEKLKAMAYLDGKRMAEEKAAPYGSIMISHKEFISDFKPSIVERVLDREFDLEWNPSDEDEMKSFMEGIEHYERNVSIDGDWV
jgi:hypothetical protein